MLSGFQRVKLCPHPELHRPKAIPLLLSAGSLLPPFGVWEGEWEGKVLCLNILIVYFEDKGKPLREVKTISHCSMPFVMWRHWCDAAHISTHVRNLLLFQTKFKCISVHSDSHLQIQVTLFLAYHCTAVSSSKPQSSLLLHCMFTAHNWALQAQLPHRGWEFSLAPFSFRGAGNDLPLPPTTVHNTPVLVETISWLGHTKAAALFGNKLLKSSWEQPQTAALQQNLKHSLSLAFLSATSTKKEAFWGNPLRLGWDSLTHWVHNCSTV